VDFELNEDQIAILHGLDQMLAGLQIEPPRHGETLVYGAAVDSELASSGFLDVGREQNFSTLESALIAERLARLPVTVEASSSAIIGPLFPPDEVERPLALAQGSPLVPARFLPQARSLLVDLGDDLLHVSVDPARVEPVDSLFAYPYGRLTRLEGLMTRSLGRGALAPFRRRWRMALAAESAGLMRSAMDTVLEHVKTRHQFGRPLGSFQAIQHRLAMGSGTMNGTYWLAMRAAWTDSDSDCAVAATYAQDAIPTFTYDLHQFCGAMGLTLEFPLHYWTYRLKALLGELGGSSAQARAASALTWTRA